MTPKPVSSTDPTQTPPHEYIPPALDHEWRAYLERFAQHYGLDTEQRTLAAAVLVQNEDKAALWLLGKPPHGTSTIIRPSPFGPAVSETKTTPERLAEYLQTLAEARRIQEHEFSADIGKAFHARASGKMFEAKTEIARLRAELRAELATRTDRMKDELHGILRAEQLAKPVMPDRPWWQNWSEWRAWSRLDWLDHLVPFALVGIGGCLLVGLLTRTACVSGAILLFGFYLAMPPLPGLPDNPHAEGHYLFISKNLIEIVALLALATTASGRWAGLDGLLFFLSPWRRRGGKDTRDVAAPATFR
jgi:uncharacterized membrane protein YphA (DoxX/SURF4 family)